MPGDAPCPRADGTTRLSTVKHGQHTSRVYSLLGMGTLKTLVWTKTRVVWARFAAVYSSVPLSTCRVTADNTHAAVACLGGVAARSSIQGHENPDGIFSWDDQFEDVRE